jgi:hypothetical protein
VRAPGVLRELAHGEVGLLLAGAGFAEGHAPDPYRRRTMAGIVRPTAHLAGFRCLGYVGRQVFLLPANNHASPFRPFGFYALLIVFRIGGGFASSERTILVALKDDRGHRGAQKVRTIPTAI